MNFLFIDFLNSEWRDGVHPDFLEDRLEKPGWLDQVLADWGIRTPGEPFPEKALKRFRAWLRLLTMDLTRGIPPDEEALSHLNACLAHRPVRRQLRQEGDSFEWKLTPVEMDWDGVKAEIAASFAELLVRHDPGRVRICGNDACLWFFYDESRNRSRRWCDHRTCGNRMNVRRHRARQSGKPSTPEGR
ncbi:putative RNA-binding Zn ribbon-like protein [Melghirimyces profundicolus]|uniref:Putative RNA-binding Zn ribbon-like protein n=1 Tax=Melghirimyces profundicolus TaxID=1242148 RepID=A0A2T6C7N6_9BACL|nr:CGNR zinc finger domain-containing protein [Melghirimyces profundicolus]PTX64334.1 putative RNA-binding Zn ribbon-like protein [Melghirimyces profundicolus]